MSGQSSQSSDSQLSDAEPNESTIPFIMYRAGVDKKTGLGTFHLEMPSSEGVSKTKSNEYPLILLEIKDQDQKESLMRMKQLHHENVLGVHFFDENGVGDARCIRAYVEPYTGYLPELFRNAAFFVNKETELVPSEPFQEFVRASLSGLDCIIKNNLYHGNFSWETTVYRQDEGRRTLKLCNFETIKDKDLLQRQIGDCHALAHCLEKVSRRVQDEYVDFRPDTCCLIDDLARRLRDVNNMESLSTMKQKNQDHVFFWDNKRNRTFCAYEMRSVLFRPAFLQSFQNSLSVPTLPWDTLWVGHALLGAMKKYRQTHNIAPYKFNEMHDFLLFISGLYSHPIEIKEEVPHLNINASVHEIHPRLLLDLKRAVDVDARAADVNAMDVDNP